MKGGTECVSIASGTGSAEKGDLQDQAADRRREAVIGVHGWYFQNQSVKPVTVRLRLAGFYNLVPGGQAGNEMSIPARRME